MKTKFKSITWFVSLAAAAVVLAGCNTADGIGKDVEQLGEELQEAAD
ncbi:hypothetical protein [Pelagicoccus sp. SDUM812003]|nr:hypothetical protein [Pelagicoccus sp. SDUM812003]